MVNNESDSLDSKLFFFFSLFHYPKAPLAPFVPNLQEYGVVSSDNSLIIVCYLLSSFIYPRITCVLL